MKEPIWLQDEQRMLGIEMFVGAKINQFKINKPQDKNITK